MPNEVIAGTIGTAGNSVRLVVRWGRRETTYMPEGSDFPCVSVSDGVMVATEALQTAEDGKSSDWEALGATWELDRGDVNELIRVLRKARDQAFGRDE